MSENDVAAWIEVCIYNMICWKFIKKHFLQVSVSEYRFFLISIFPYKEYNLRFCPYTGKYGSVKSCILEWFQSSNCRVFGEMFWYYSYKFIKICSWASSTFKRGIVLKILARTSRFWSKWKKIKKFSLTISLAVTVRCSWNTLLLEVGTAYNTQSSHTLWRILVDVLVINFY